MALVLTARPGANVINDDLVGRARLAVSSAVGSEAVGAARWLAPGDACEILVSLAGGLPEQRSAVRLAAEVALGATPIDCNLVEDGPHRRKRLLIADMDSTIIEQECIDEMADMLGAKPAIAAITERAMRGELDFEAALKERVGMLRGLTVADLTRVYDERVTLMPGARSLLATMRANLAIAALVSGGFTFFTSRVAVRAGFDVTYGNELEIVDGAMTGRVIEPILGREAKLAALRRTADERGIDMVDTLAVGDGANDLAMIQAAGLGVAYRAKPIVAAAAQASVRHGDLTALLYLQGYRREEFAPAN
jgi:phosphoserine phosphatase